MSIKCILLIKFCTTLCIKNISSLMDWFYKSPLKLWSLTNNEPILPKQPLYECCNYLKVESQPLYLRLAASSQAGITFYNRMVCRRKDYFCPTIQNTIYDNRHLLLFFSYTNILLFVVLLLHPIFGKNISCFPNLFWKTEKEVVRSTVIK